MSRTFTIQGNREVYAFWYDFQYKDKWCCGEWSDNGKQFRFGIFDREGILAQTSFHDSIKEAIKASKQVIDAEDWNIRDVPF